MKETFMFVPNKLHNNFQMGRPYDLDIALKHPTVRYLLCRYFSLLALQIFTKSSGVRRHIVNVSRIVYQDIESKSLGDLRTASATN